MKFGRQIMNTPTTCTVHETLPVTQQWKMSTGTLLVTVVVRSTLHNMRESSKKT
jgi:hypothetical protein